MERRTSGRAPLGESMKSSITQGGLGPKSKYPKGLPPNPAKTLQQPLICTIAICTSAKGIPDRLMLQAWMFAYLSCSLHDGHSQFWGAARQQSPDIQYMGNTRADTQLRNAANKSIRKTEAWLLACTWSSHNPNSNSTGSKYRKEW